MKAGTRVVATRRIVAINRLTHRALRFAEFGDVGTVRAGGLVRFPGAPHDLTCVGLDVMAMG